jgi:hypothetical protein
MPFADPQLLPKSRLQHRGLGWHRHVLQISKRDEIRTERTWVITVGGICMSLNTALEIVTQRGSFLAKVVVILIVVLLIKYRRRRANRAVMNHTQQLAQAAVHGQLNARQDAYVLPYGGPGGYDPTDAGVGTPRAYGPNAGAYEPPKESLYQSPMTTGTFSKPAAPHTTGEVPQYPPPTYSGSS